MANPSIEQYHKIWLSMLEPSGAFLSTGVLKEEFAQGLDKTPSHIRRQLRAAYEEWIHDQDEGSPDLALHTSWILFVLENLLGMTRFRPGFASSKALLREGAAIPAHLHYYAAEHRVDLAPDYVLGDPVDSNKAHLLIKTYPPEQNLQQPLPHQSWPPSPLEGMRELLLQLSTQLDQAMLGLLTNGEEWILVYMPPKEIGGHATWLAHSWLEEPLLLNSFYNLLAQYRFFAEEKRTLLSMLTRSADFQLDVTDQLGYQVRRAVDVLVRKLDQIDDANGRQYLCDLQPEQVYEAALMVMMRLVFLFFAEEHHLLPKDEQLYDEFYAASTMLDQLRATESKFASSFLQQKHDAWSRLLSLFRIVYAGVNHQDLSLRAYDGHLFDPDRFPFLEGRAAGTSWRDTTAEPLPIDNYTVLQLLENIQFLKGKRKTDPAMRLSFKGLDIEQIGHIYESLLDHTVSRASEPVLGLAVKEGRFVHNDEGVDVPLAALAKLLAEKGRGELLTFLADLTERKEAALAKALDACFNPHELDQLRSVCDNDQALFERVLPFAGLLRWDSFGYPLVVLEGALYMTRGMTRRLSGAHYTPRSLTEPMVKHTIDPLVYIGIAEGWPENQRRLRTPREILNLKVCDMAMGSGAFLVQICRYLASVLLEAWERIELNYADPTNLSISPYGDDITNQAGELAVPQERGEREALALRLVAEHCLYGVDKNPLAVEMAKLSLWLITLSKDKPFTFLDHALRCGDSLLGVDLEQLQAFSLGAGGPAEGSIIGWAGGYLEPAITRAFQKRAELHNLNGETIADVAEMRSLNAEANQAMELVRLGADILVYEALDWYFRNKVARERRFHSFAEKDTTAEDVETEEKKIADQLSFTYANLLANYHDNPVASEIIFQRLRANVTTLLGDRAPFHWVLAFPEVFVEIDQKGAIHNGLAHGFDALISNPPFQGGQRITGALGTDYREYLVEHLAAGQRGSADLCAYFFLKATTMIRPAGQCALVATNTIAQGDTREVGLDQILDRGWTILRAVPSRKWPGSANLEIAQVWLRKGKWQAEYVLEKQPVAGITAYLAERTETAGKPYKLEANAKKSFIGSYVLGMGFVLQPEEAQALIAKDPRNRDVLFPYLNGEDLNSRPDQSPSRWVINFFDWPLEQAETYADCMQIVREKVKPERDKLGLRNEPTAQGRARLWWQYGRRSGALYSAIASMERVLALTIVTAHFVPAFCPPNWVFAHRCCIFPLDRWEHYALIQSNIHEKWARNYSSSLETRLNYSPSDCFETFPFPLDISSLEDIGTRYYTHRQSIMQARQEGLTDTYNRFHRKSETAADIVKLRELHQEMDEAVAQAYGWDDLALEHGFYQTKQGPRYTISEQARREVLGRLLKLNHERYTEEVAAGQHEKGAAKGKGGKKARGGKLKSEVYVVDTAQPAPEATSPDTSPRAYWIGAWQAGEQQPVAPPLLPDEMRPELWEQAQTKEDADGEAG